MRHTVSRPCAPVSPLSSLQGEPGSGKAPQRYKRRAGRRDGERAAKKAKKGHQAVAGRQLADVSHVSSGQHTMFGGWLAWARAAEEGGGVDAARFSRAFGSRLALLVSGAPRAQVEVESDMLSEFKIWFANTKGYK